MVTITPQYHFIALCHWRSNSRPHLRRCSPPPSTHFYFWKLRGNLPITIANSNHGYSIREWKATTSTLAGRRGKKDSEKNSPANPNYERQLTKLKMMSLQSFFLKLKRNLLSYFWRITMSLKSTQQKDSTVIAIRKQKLNSLFDSFLMYYEYPQEINMGIILFMLN